MDTERVIRSRPRRCSLLGDRAMWPKRGLYAFTGRAVLRADRAVVARPQEYRWLAVLLWQQARTHWR